MGRLAIFPRFASAVEFRETLKGTTGTTSTSTEKAASKRKVCRELRQSGERLRQAAEHISQLEAALAEKPAPSRPNRWWPTTPCSGRCCWPRSSSTRPRPTPSQAIRIIAEADAKARQMTDQAQTKASQIAAESEQRLRDEITGWKSRAPNSPTRSNRCPAT